MFKGIALFTPGGGLVYGIDSHKQAHWHLHLCACLRDLLGLPEPPHFLVPCFTATVDRWVDSAGRVQTVGEAAPAVMKYAPLLNVVFGTQNLIWQTMPMPEGLCDPIVLLSHRKQFPQLWEPHDLVAHYGRLGREPSPQSTEILPTLLASPERPTEGYVFRLFVAGHNAATESILQTLHQLLEQSLCQPYTLKVIDVAKHPELAEQAQVSATPTLVKVWPQPVRRIVGSLTNAEQVLRLLGTGEGWSR